MWQLIDTLPDALEPHSWTCQSLLMIETEKEVKYPFYYRNLLDCICLLLRHFPFKKDLVWLLVRRFSNAERTDRVYSDMHIADH